MSRHDKHLSESEARLLVTQRLSFADAFRVGLHVYFCERCRKLCERLDPEGLKAFLQAFHGTEDPEDLPTHPDPGAMAKHLQEAYLAQHQVESLERKIESLPPAQRRLLLENLETIPLLATLIAICKTCKRLFHTSPKDAEDLAALGRELLAERADELDVDHAVSLEVTLRALHGNAFRILGQLRKAERTLRKALKLSRDVSDPLERAWAWRYLGQTLMCSRRYEEALSASRKARQIFETVHDAWRVRETVFLEASIYNDVGDFETSTALLERMLEDGAQQDDLILAQSIEHLLALNYLEMGRAFEARGLLPRVKALASEVGGITVVRAQWLEALILEGLGDLDAAERLLGEVAERFAEEYPYDYALVTLDRMRALLRLGSVGAAARTVSALVPMLRGGRVHAHAVRALRLLAQGGLESERIGRVQAFLRHLQRDPSYTLEEAGLHA